MKWQAGIDEAGLGPILGPLVVAGVPMGGPAGADPWRALRAQVSRDRAQKGKLRVADSKKVKQGERGLARLEETVLAFHAARTGELPDCAATLLTDLGVELSALAQCPWYGDLRLPLPLENDADTLELRGHALSRTLQRGGFELGPWAVHLLDAGAYNASISETDNKSRTHFAAYGEVLAPLLRALPGGAHIVADRCGGIQHYGPALHRALGKVALRTLEEAPAQSCYELGRQRRVRVTFAVQGEARSFPTALASCVAKYLREILMRRMNNWFAERLPGLAPTAGYYTDGHRFLRDIEALTAVRGFPKQLLVRCR